MRSYNIKRRNSPDKSLSKVAARLIFSLGKIFRAILLLFGAAHLLLTGSTIALSIINQQVPKDIANEENTSESSMVVPLVAKTTGLQLTKISLNPGAHVMQI